MPNYEYCLSLVPLYSLVFCFLSLGSYSQDLLRTSWPWYFTSSLLTKKCNICFLAEKKYNFIEGEAGLPQNCWAFKWFFSASQSNKLSVGEKIRTPGVCAIKHYRLVINGLCSKSSKLVLLCVQASMFVQARIHQLTSKFAIYQ